MKTGKTENINLNKCYNYLLAFNYMSWEIKQQKYLEIDKLVITGNIVH